MSRTYTTTGNRSKMIIMHLLVLIQEGVFGF